MPFRHVDLTHYRRVANKEWALPVISRYFKTHRDFARTLNIGEAAPARIVGIRNWSHSSLLKLRYTFSLCGRGSAEIRWRISVE